MDFDNDYYVNIIHLFFANHIYKVTNWLICLIVKMLLNI